MLQNLLLILGVAVLTFALRTFQSVFLQRLGILGVLVTSFLIGWLFTGYVVVGLLCASTWLLLPWLEILVRVRRLKLPVEKSLRPKTPPSAEVFPALDTITESIEERGFTHLEDAGWEWEDYSQFFRIFYHSAERMQCAICVIDQGSSAFYYISISSRGKNGTIWTTWNYPFSYSLKLVPAWRVNRVSSALDLVDMLDSHRLYLRKNRVIPADLEDLTAERIQEEIQKDLRSQIAHNIAAGVLTPHDDGCVRYSWRGMFFIWFQFLRDFVRFS